MFEQVITRNDIQLSDSFLRREKNQFVIDHQERPRYDKMKNHQSKGCFLCGNSDLFIDDYCKSCADLIKKSY